MYSVILVITSRFDNQLPPKKGNFANPDYVTQFVVRTNRETDFVQQQDFLDLAFVGGVLLDVAGLSPKDDFYASEYRDASAKPR